ncbi:MAG: leucyl aminopeptidase [Bacteroidota bacterium]|nr:leucyl aminopeptidase [Candidatus Kapabacteria bacterium]MCS7303212.1 leucyl aminopeptidase [Candidatus Kapabacteria bacterium]MCX7936732.1 leucyl aminopeptidase [Chlorobiota bacterium]MDW8074224.1 leucyl aminopeptidase [Bacteroidota bacterium]MDW8271300.1 leucyl aminopeptidase [Bacteroidota bacterium]
MKVRYQQVSPYQVRAEAIAYFLPSDEPYRTATLDRIREEFPSVAPALSSTDASGKRGTALLAYAADQDRSRKVVLVGVGQTNELTAETFRRAASTAARRVQNGIRSCALVLPEWSPLTAEDTAYAIVEGAVLGSYKFGRYKTVDPPEQLEEISILGTERSVTVRRAIEQAAIVCKGVYLARDLANMPGNDLYPETLAEYARQASMEAGFRVEVFTKRKIEQLKMGGLLAVNQGSVRPPVFIVMEWRGGKSKDAPIVLVGKGITFDTGGISIKPAERMGEMKMDMHGAASVIGTLYAAAKLKLPVNVVGLVPATENMPSGSAYRPGDIIRFMNGKTAEIDNTDAEGRLILADALTYAERYSPKAVVDIATLTGACVIALGHVTTGLMGTDRLLLERIKVAAEKTGEYVCELPLYDEYLEQIKSDVADVKNSGGRPAGAITAALFLKHFIGNYPWAHLDIAGTGMAPKEGPYTPKGGTGVGVRLFVEMLRSWDTGT